MLKFPLFRSKSARRAPRANDRSLSVDTLSQTMYLPKVFLKSRDLECDRSSTPPSSSSSEVSTPGGSPPPDGFLPLDLPRFPSLEEALPDSWKSVKVEQEESSTNNCGMLIRDRRDDLIGELLDQITLLRQKVRTLGDDNSRLRRELTRKRPQELTINDAKSTSTDRPGATFHDLRLPTPPIKEFTPLEGVKIDSPKESNASEYSYHHYLEYFPSPPTSIPIRRRQRTDSLRIGGATSQWGSLKRQRCHSLPTPKNLLQYSESRPRDNGKLELPPDLIQLIQQRCSSSTQESEPAVQPTPESEDIVLPFWEQSVPPTPMPELLMPKPIKAEAPKSPKRLARRPQSRVKLTVLDPIFRCFVCSQRSGHCEYHDAVWVGDRYAFFGYFELKYFDWFSASSGHSRNHNHDAEVVNERLNEIEVEEEIRHYVGNVLDEVELPSIDDEVPSSQYLFSPISREDSEMYLYSSEGTVTEALARRERHIALLDSIMEEEEHEDAPLSEPSLPPLPMTRRSSWTSARPVYVSRLTQSTLASIPEQEDSFDSDSTNSNCPPLTEDSGSSSPESQSRKSTVTFDDFEDLDFEAVLPPAGSGGRTRKSSWPPSEVNTVAFPGTKPPTESLAWWNDATAKTR